MSKPSAKRRQRRSFTKEFKAEAAQLVLARDRPIAQVAKVIESLDDDPGQQRRVGEAAFNCTWRRVG